MTHPCDIAGRCLAQVASLLLAALIGACGAGGPRTDGGPDAERPAARVLAFAAGRWFDGASFKDSTAYAVNGVLTFTRPGRVDSTIDLAAAT